MKNEIKFFLKSLINLLKEVYKFVIIKFHFKNIFKIRYIFAIIGIYVIVLISIIILYLDIPYNFDKSKTTIAVYGPTDQIDEAMLQERIVIGAKKNGWNVINAKLPVWLSINKYTKHFLYLSLSLVNAVYKPKFNLHISPRLILQPLGYNIMYLNLQNEMLFAPNGEFKGHKNIDKYDAFIDVYNVANDDENPYLKKALAKKRRYNIPIISLCFIPNYIEYSPAKREQILITGSILGCNRDTFRIKYMLQKLADNNLMVAYGPKDELKSLGNAYKGLVLNPSESFYIHKKYGISLILHTLEYMLTNIPTNRIAEAVSSGAIVISDENGFIKKFFGDNVLYINTLAPADEIYSQILKHINWIKQNPTEVEKKSKAAYDILMRDFCIEKQLFKLDDFVDKNKVRKEKL